MAARLHWLHCFIGDSLSHFRRDQKITNRQFKITTNGFFPIHSGDHFDHFLPAPSMADNQGKGSRTKSYKHEIRELEGHRVNVRSTFCLCVPVGAPGLYLQHLFSNRLSIAGNWGTEMVGSNLGCSFKLLGFFSDI